MRQARRGAPEGTCVVAREQTAGRGRLDRSWHSAMDAGLYLSIVLRPTIELSSWPLITLMTALAVQDALSKAAGLRADIKWPNDLCVNERKLSGILAETVETDAGLAAIVGIGVNLSTQGLDENIRGFATCVESETGRRVETEDLLRHLLTALADRYAMLQSEGGHEHTIREWCANSSYAFDRRVRVSTEHGTFEGVTHGLEADGALRIEIDNGKIRIVRAGDVTALRSVTVTNE